jgi:hypothetical protein
VDGLLRLFGDYLFLKPAFRADHAALIPLPACAGAAYDARLP